MEAGKGAEEGVRLEARRIPTRIILTGEGAEEGVGERGGRGAEEGGERGGRGGAG